MTQFVVFYKDGNVWFSQYYDMEWISWVQRHVKIHYNKHLIVKHNINHTNMKLLYGMQQQIYTTKNICYPNTIALTKKFERAY